MRKGGPTIRWLALALGVVLNASANILIKAAVRGLEAGWDWRSWPRILLEPYLVLGVVAFGLALTFYAYSLTRLELSVAYPVMTSLGLVVVFLFSVVVFRESIQWAKVAGALLILAGVVLLTRSG